MIDIALSYNPEMRCCDVVFNGRDFALDATPASAMLFSILAKRRAQPDDAIPTPVTDWARPSSFMARGGWCGDALDANGALVGSRMWLLQRRLANEATLLDCQNYVAEAVGWLETVRGYALQVAAGWVAPQIWGYRVRAGATTVELSQAFT